MLNIELDRIPAYFQLNGNNKRKKSEAFARTLANTLFEMYRYTAFVSLLL